jgi:hypothetical protein
MTIYRRMTLSRILVGDPKKEVTYTSVRTIYLYLLLTSKNGVGSEVGLVGGSVGLEHGLVNGTLVGGIDSHDGVGQDGVGVFDGLQATLSEVSLSSITKFMGLVDSGRSTGRDTGGKGSRRGGDIDLDCGVSSGINDFTSVDTGDGRHHALGGDSSGGLAGDRARELGQHDILYKDYYDNNINRRIGGRMKL